MWWRCAQHVRKNICVLKLNTEHCSWPNTVKAALCLYFDWPINISPVSSATLKSFLFVSLHFLVSLWVSLLSLASRNGKCEWLRLLFVLCRYAFTKALVVAFILTFFSIFDVPVFWPILLLYWVVLFVLTMKRQIRHMIKYRYIPFSLGKQVSLSIFSIVHGDSEASGWIWEWFFDTVQVVWCLVNCVFSEHGWVLLCHSLTTSLWASAVLQ